MGKETNFENMVYYLRDNGKVTTKVNLSFNRALSKKELVFLKEVIVSVTLADEFN